MRINGSEIAREYRCIKLPRTKTVNGVVEDCSIPLRVHSLPLGVQAEFDRMFPRPLPPKKTVGKIVGGQVKDEATDDVDDPTWISALLERDSLRSFHRLYHALILDPNVTFTVIPIDRESLFALRDEVIKSGLSDGDILLILSASAEAGNISNAQIEKARGGF